MAKRKVHITDANGKIIYNRLWDDGTLVIRFDSGSGFVDRLMVKVRSWVIVDGWAF